MKSHQVASSLRPAALLEPEADAPEVPALDGDADEAALDEAGVTAAAALDAVETPLLEPEAAGVLLLPHADRTSVIAPIPAMVAIALLADVRNTRPTSVSWESRCEGAHNNGNESVFIANLQAGVGNKPVTIV